MEKIAIIGTRRRNDEASYIRVEAAFLSIYKEGDMIISGGCSRGGDRFAEVIAKKYNIPIKIYRAEWRRFGLGAGFIRNTDIAWDSTKLIACVAENRTGGTEDTIRKFLELNLKDNLTLVKEVDNEKHTLVKRRRK